METKNMEQIDVGPWICENQKFLIAIVRRYAPIRGRTVNAEKAKDGVSWTMRDLLMVDILPRLKPWNSLD